MKKLVSVIIPTYNRADKIVKAIQSVKAQNYPEIQLIIADDGSNDGTDEIIKQFADIEYYYQENKGQGAARNLGLKHAKGDYVASLDSDDIWHEDFLTVAVDALERFEADFVFLNWTEVLENTTQRSAWERSKDWVKYRKNSTDDWTFLDAAQVRKLFLKTCPAPSSSLLIRHSSMTVAWNEEMKIADDWCLILDMVISKPRRAAFTIRHYWTKYVNTDNIYHGRNQIEVIENLGLHDELLIAERFENQLTASEKSILKKRLAQHHLNLGRLNLKSNGFSMKYIGSIATAFKFAPLSIVFHLMQLSYYSVKNRSRIVQNKP